MASISIGDLTGTAQIDVSADSYLGQNKLSALTSSVSNLRASLPTPLGELGTAGHPPAFKDVKFGASFTKPSIAILGSTLQATAGVNSAISLYSKANNPLFGHDDYDSDVTIGDGQYWASFELDTLLDLQANIPVGSGGFGVTAEGSTASTFYTYCEVADNEPAVTLQDAFQDVLGAFSIPLSSTDVLTIKPGRIYTKDIAGTVKLGGQWSLPLSVNQMSLASTGLPFNSSVAVQPAITLTVAGDIAVTGEFNVRLRRSDANHLRMGVYKVQTRALEASFTASAGLNANLGNTDLISVFFTALSNGRGFDASSISKADLQTFQQVLKDSINRSLSIAINDSFTDTNSTESAVVYELDVTAPDESLKNAINSALGGDWTLLSQHPRATRVRNVIIESTERKTKLAVNILGLYNYESISDFVKSMRMVTADDGSVTITDSSTATRIAVASNALAADADKLRQALYESFSATAIYKALAAGVGVSTDFSATQDFLLVRDSMTYADAFTVLNTGEALGVMPAGVKTNLPNPTIAGAPKNVNHPRFAASCTYSSEEVLKFFFSNNSFSDLNSLQPREQDELEKIGRKVLASLLNYQNPTDQKRISMLLDDKAWAGLDAQGSKIPEPYYSDWYDISVAWSPAIAKVGPLLKDAITYGKTVQGDPAKDQAFMNKREAVLRAFGSATHNTHAANNPTFPICVMATLAGRTPGAPSPDFEASWNGKQIFSNKQQALAAAARPGQT